MFLSTETVKYRNVTRAKNLVPVIENNSTVFASNVSLQIESVRFITLHSFV